MAPFRGGAQLLTIVFLFVILSVVIYGDLAYKLRDSW